jgi:hypothetical protein
MSGKKGRGLLGDRYHATAVEKNRYLRQCITYIDMNMVRAGVYSLANSVMRRISIIDGPIFKQYDGSKMGYRANIVFGNSDGADFRYQLHFRAIKSD